MIETCSATFTFSVFFSKADGEFVATCDEYPSLSWLADTEVAAQAGLMRLIADCLDDARAEGGAWHGRHG